MSSPDRAFTFVDLFAGIGGFAVALRDLGGECVGSVELDRQAAAVYALNHGTNPFGDITEMANEDRVAFDEHTVLAAGFPCQPFSKSGSQKGMDEVRGTLFWNILKIVEARRPAVLLLENVRNLAGPRHRHEWDVIVKSLRQAGYHVSSRPAVFSPHLLPSEQGGQPQIRERVFITATYWPERSWEDPVPAVQNRMVRTDPWDLENDLPLDSRRHIPGCDLSADERRWIDAWENFRQLVVASLMHTAPNRLLDEVRLPGFPIWVDAWEDDADLEIPEGTPRWKQVFLRKNATFYTQHRSVLDPWIKQHGVMAFPPSRRKFEWQAQQESSLWNCAIQLRPSGIRAKRMTHLPALVAMSQTPILGPKRRRLSVAEAAALQGLPSDFTFGDQPDSASYKQLGNGVNVGVVQHVLRQHVSRDIERIRLIAPDLLAAVGVVPVAPVEAQLSLV
ncbi:DNA (cytosine-5-)-methyltransferase [Aquipuribacter hungaricus]|uniref:DNA (cytosine-5-)-methyltransferase n=1 Tax=Aquipuribacter hungaricus TaxID=545624 RepID=A0ABV7WCJ7_9MICO